MSCTLTIAILCIILSIILLLKLSTNKQQFDYIQGLTTGSLNDLKTLLTNTINSSIQALKNTPIQSGMLCTGSTLADLRLQDAATKCDKTLGIDKGFDYAGGVVKAGIEGKLTALEGLGDLKITQLKNVNLVKTLDNKLKLSLDISLKTRVRVFTTLKIKTPVFLPDVSLTNNELTADFDYTLTLQKLTFTMLTTSNNTIRFDSQSKLQMEKLVSFIPPQPQWNWFPNLGQFGYILGLIIGELISLVTKIIAGNDLSNFINNQIVDQLSNTIKGVSFSTSEFPFTYKEPPQGPSLIVPTGGIQFGNWMMYNKPESAWQLILACLNTDDNTVKSSAFHWQNDTTKFFTSSLYQPKFDSTDVQLNLPPIWHCGKWIIYADASATQLQFIYDYQSQAYTLDANTMQWSSTQSPSKFIYGIYDNTTNYTCISLGKWRIVTNAKNEGNTIHFYYQSSLYQDAQHMILQFTSNNQYQLTNISFNQSIHDLIIGADCNTSYQIQMKMSVPTYSTDLLTMNVMNFPSASATSSIPYVGLSPDANTYWFTKQQQMYGVSISMNKIYMLAYTYISASLSSFIGKTVQLTTDKGYSLLLMSTHKIGDIVMFVVEVDKASSIGSIGVINKAIVVVATQNPSTPVTYQPAQNVNILITINTSIQTDGNQIMLMSATKQQVYLSFSSKLSSYRFRRYQAPKSESALCLQDQANGTLSCMDCTQQKLSVNPVGLCSTLFTDPLDAILPVCTVSDVPLTPTTNLKPFIITSLDAQQTVPYKMCVGSINFFDGIPGKTRGRYPDDLANKLWNPLNCDQYYNSAGKPLYDYTSWCNALIIDDDISKDTNALVKTAVDVSQQYCPSQSQIQNLPYKLCVGLITKFNGVPGQSRGNYPDELANKVWNPLSCDQYYDTTVSPPKPFYGLTSISSMCDTIKTWESSIKDPIQLTALQAAKTYCS